MHQNPFSAGAQPRIPLGELTMLPQTPYMAGEGDIPSPFPSPLDAFSAYVTLFAQWNNSDHFLSQYQIQTRQGAPANDVYSASALLIQMQHPGF